DARRAAGNGTIAAADLAHEQHDRLEEARAHDVVLARRERAARVEASERAVVVPAAERAARARGLGQVDDRAGRVVAAAGAARGARRIRRDRAGAVPELGDRDEEGERRADVLGTGLHDGARRAVAHAAE